MACTSDGLGWCRLGEDEVVVRKSMSCHLGEALEGMPKLP